MATKPVKNGVITCTYEQHVARGQKGSFGIDIGSIAPATEKIDILLCYKSLIVATGLSSTFGNRVWTQVLEGKYKDKFIVYPHMDSIEDGVFLGKVYNEGTILGHMGNTGLIMDSSGKIVNNNDKHIPLSKGRHLHLECRGKIEDSTTSIKLEEINNLYIS